MADGAYDKNHAPGSPARAEWLRWLLQPCHAFREGRRSLFRRRDNIVGILQEVVGGILIAGLFGTGHRMAAYEADPPSREMLPSPWIFVLVLPTSVTIAPFDKRFDLLQIIGIIFHGGAEENDITFRQVFVDTVQNYIHNPIPLCLFQLLSVRMYAIILVPGALRFSPLATEPPIRPSPINATVKSVIVNPP